MYLENAKRTTAEASFSDYDEYLESLDMSAEISSFIPMYYSRITQLCNKSNQFNLTTRRYTQAEIEKIAVDNSYIKLYGKLKDKFGDNGVVSVVIGHQVDDVVDVDLWIMSCRVLKRGMEYAMMDRFAEECRRRNVNTIIGHYYPTGKNGMMKEFYGLQGFSKEDEDEIGNTTWSLHLNEYIMKNHVIDLKHRSDVQER